MASRPKALDILRHAPGQAADLALITGLSHVDASLQSEIVRVIFERNMEDGLNLVPTVFDRLAPAAKAQVLANTQRLFTALRLCIRSSDAQTRENALDIVRESGNLRLAYLAGHAIHDASPKIRAEAAMTLLTMADKHYQAYAQTTAILRDSLDPNIDMSRVIGHTLQLVREERQYLLSTLRETIQHYENHHRPEILEAAMLFAHELEESLFDHSTIKRGQRTHAMMEILHHGLVPRNVPFIYVALCYPELRRRLIGDIGACRDSEFFVEFIRWHWLARDPAIRRHLVTIRNLHWLNDGFEVSFSLPPDVAVMAPAWLLSLGLPNDQKVSLLRHFLLLDNARANRAAAYSLVEIKSPSSTLALQQLLDHEDPALQNIAQCELHARSRQLPQQIIAPVGRPGPWARLLHSAGLAETFDDFWNNFERIDPGTSEAGPLALKYVPGMMTQIQMRLMGNSPTDRLRALQLIMSLRLCERFQRDVFNLANDKSPEMRALTMKALAQMGGETARRIALRGLSDGVFEVQAAAIATLDHIAAPQRGELVADKVKSPNPGVRAAAITCLLRLHTSNSPAALVSMLNDPRADHRYAALGIVGSMRLDTLTGRIQEMANCDPDPRIARVARHLLKDLGKRTQATFEVSA